MPLRCTRKTPFLLALALFAGLASAADGSMRVQLEPSAGNPPSAQRIGIRGTAPSGCVPAIDHTTIDGADISIVLSVPATGCKPQRQIPFHLDADPAAVAGLRALPPQVFRIRVYADSGAGASLAAFGLVDTSSSALAPIPESGFWWSQPIPDSNAPVAGSGMSLEIQDNQIAGSLLGFADTGSATWYFGSATMTARTARIPLVHLANGDSWFSAIGTRPDVESGPRIELEFLSPTRARAYLVRSEEGRDVEVRSLAFSRTVFATGPSGTAWTGRWVLVAGDGRGARVFDFSASTSRDAESFQLVDAAGNANLDCRLAAGTTHPDACTLSALAGPLVDFDQVGFDHLSGHDANGAPIQMLRVPR